MSGRPTTATSISNFITPVQFARLSADVKSWRDAIREAELAFYPMRVRMQRIYMDTVENPFIKAIIERWFELTLQRDYQVYQVKNGVKVISKDLSQQLQEQTWFDEYIKGILEAELYGYSLIELGDITSVEGNDGFYNLKCIQRENIRPDGRREEPGIPILTSLIYSLDGLQISPLDPLVDMFNHWIPTRSNRGKSCGYGLLYNIALCEILMRKTNEWNADFVEMFGQPIKKGKTRKVGPERDQFEAFLASSASSAWFLGDLNTEDDITYEMVQNAGTAWKSYDNFIGRQEAIINQLFLGHTDSMKSTAGKLGGMVTQSKDGFGISLVEQALNAKKVKYGDFTKKVIDNIGAPRFRRIGRYTGSKLIAGLFPSPEYKFDLHNDVEERETRMRKNADMRVTGEWVKLLYDGGLQVDEKEVEEWTGFKLTRVIPTKKLEEVRENTLAKVTKPTVPDKTGSIDRTPDKITE